MCFTGEVVCTTLIKFMFLSAYEKLTLQQCQSLKSQLITFGYPYRILRMALKFSKAMKTLTFVFFFGQNENKKCYDTDLVSSRSSMNDSESVKMLYSKVF